MLLKAKRALAIKGKKASMRIKGKKGEKGDTVLLIVTYSNDIGPSSPLGRFSLHLSDNLP